MPTSTDYRLDTVGIVTTKMVGRRHVNGGPAPVSASNGGNGRIAVWSELKNLGDTNRPEVLILPADQISVPSDKVSASSASTPRYRTVLSSFVWPRRI